MVVCGSCGRPGTDDDLLRPSEVTGNLQHAACEAREASKFKEWVSANIEREKVKNDPDLSLALQLAKGHGLLAAAEKLRNLRPFWVDDNGLLWLWDADRRAWRLSKDLARRPNELIGVMRTALSLLGDTSVVHERHLSTAIFQVGMDPHLRPELLGKEWVQLGAELHNIATGEMRDSSPKWFVPCATPWTPGSTVETPRLDQLFTDWVGADRVATLYELFAYSLYRGYPIHVIVTLFGSGLNGKSRVAAALTKFLGEENIGKTSVERLISNPRFETMSFYGKLVAFCGEADEAVISKTALLKELSGDDSVAFEQKGGPVFRAVNTAKLIIGTNNLPPSTDNSDGWVRRMLIIDFPNQFQEGRDILETVPDEEYHALARKCLAVLPALLKRGSFTGQGSVEERRKNYVIHAEPIKQFLAEHYEEADGDSFVRYAEVYNDYCSWLEERRLRKPTQKVFTDMMGKLRHSSERRSIKVAEHYYKTIYIFPGLISKKYTFAPFIPIAVDSHSALTRIEPSGGPVQSVQSVQKYTFDATLPEVVIRPYPAVDWLRARLGSLATADEIAQGAGIPLDAVLSELRDAAARGDVIEPRSGCWYAL